MPTLGFNHSTSHTATLAIDQSLRPHHHEQGRELENYTEQA